jgi:hypothetical protein
MATRKREQTPEQKQRFDAFLEIARELEGEVGQNKRSEQTKRLTSHAQALPGLQRYSELNQLLILKQRPDATEVYTFAGWREHGRKVKRGEKAIYIRAPRPRTDGEEGKAGFRTLIIFDLAQTEPLTEEAAETTQESEE